MNTYDIPCSINDCPMLLPPDRLWLAEGKHLTATNGGRQVRIADYPKFALCGSHGHALRHTGVRVYRYAQSVERAEEMAYSRYCLDYLGWWKSVRRAEYQRFEADYYDWWLNQSATDGLPLSH